MEMQKNDSIQCTVTNCKFNNETQKYCTLNQIMVGTHEQNPTVPECTDCQSFKNKQ